MTFPTIKDILLWMVHPRGTRMLMQWVNDNSMHWDKESPTLWGFQMFLATALDYVRIASFFLLVLATILVIKIQLG